MKIKDKLIHLLGGITEQEAKERKSHDEQIGAYTAMRYMEAYMREINGVDADTWCNLVWLFVCNKIKSSINFIRHED